jgi:hypothetical protein
MTIEGVLPHGRPLALDGSVLQPTAPAPLILSETSDEARSARADGGARVPLPPRRTSSVLRQRVLQNRPVTRVNVGQPGVSSSDSQLAQALEEDFGRLHPFLSEGRLTWLSLQRAAVEGLGKSEELDRTIQVVGEILKRPRLSDAILSRDGDITRDSLRAAAQTMKRNSSPSVFSVDPFHAQGNVHVVKALQDQFEQLRDKSQDRTFLFEQYQYVEIATLEAIMKDPYAFDPQGTPVLDPSNGMQRPKYSRLWVFTAKNILGRLGLLPSLIRANGARLFGPPQKEGWLSKQSLERWQEEELARKSR